MARVDADRNLLYGLLALQTGLIDQGTLFNAFHAWTRDKSRVLSDHLAELGVLTASRRALLEGLVDEHLGLHDGDPEKSLSSLRAERSTVESLSGIGDPELTALLDAVAPTSPMDDPDATASVGVSTSAASGFESSGPTLKGAWASSPLPSTAS